MNSYSALSTLHLLRIEGQENRDMALQEPQMGFKKELSYLRPGFCELLNEK